MKTIEVTLEEIKMATRPNVYRNKKKYTRKNKHKNDTKSKTCTTDSKIETIITYKDTIIKVPGETVILL